MKKLAKSKMVDLSIRSSLKKLALKGRVSVILLFPVDHIIMDDEEI